MLVAEFVRGKALPSIVTFKTEVIEKWLAEAQVSRAINRVIFASKIYVYV
jgi:hypothetical protein